MKKKSKSQVKKVSKPKEVCLSILTIKSFPQTWRGREKMSNWLRKTADTIDMSKPEDYSKIVRFRLFH